MARQQFKKCLGVDIGTTSVKIAECSFEKGTLRIGALITADLPQFPDADAAELGTAKVIKDLLKANKLTTKEAVFSLPGQQVFSRRVRLPDSSEERLARIINYEARQQIPFPPDKTRIEYEIFREPGEDEVEVLMVAARKDQIESFMRLVDRTGLTPVGLSVSSISLFNYVALLLTPDPIIEPIAPKKKKKAAKKKKAKKGAEESAGEAEAESDIEMDLGEGGGDDDGFVMEEAKALLSIGESNTDLIIIRTGKNTNLAFMRSIPIAGREFSRFIQNSVGLESFAEAERIKREATRVFPPEGEPPDDPGIDISASSALSEIIDSKLSRQIQLSLDFFIAQPDGLAVEEIVLSGGSSQIPGIESVLEERLAVPVTVLDDPMSEVVLLNTTPPAPMANFAVATGEAMTGLGVGRAAINFLPDRYKTRLGFPRMQVAFLTVMLIAMIGLGSQMGDTSTQARVERAESYQQEVSSLQPQQTQITNATNTRQQLKARFERFNEAFDSSGRDYIVRFYADFTAIFREAAANAFLEELTVSPYGNVVIRGRSLDNLAAAGIRQSLIDDMKDYLQPNRPPILVRNARDNNGVYTFEINAYLKNKSSRINTPTPAPRRQ